MSYTSPEMLEAVYNQIEALLPDGWSIDQRSECISVTWPDMSPKNSAIRAKVLNQVIQEITDGQHQEIFTDHNKLQLLIDQRVEELLKDVPKPPRDANVGDWDNGS